MRIIKLGDDFKMIEKYNRIGEDIYIESAKETIIDMFRLIAMIILGAFK